MRCRNCKLVHGSYQCVSTHVCYKPYCPVNDMNRGKQLHFFFVDNMEDDCFRLMSLEEVHELELLEKSII